ncbi:signal peptidase I [Frigoribacterium sp. CFBP9030]|uniref:signal peptidase I n=1 Tax=unclassified Frigoribacterium TaxID=2627005 RepID=UPI002A69A6D5|nr:signal peptidase I [Frigoribacterium sp. CFBP9030]MDY0891376.1 signal peptidase I [Frigoribacterium sp. CFBP9030]
MTARRASSAERGLLHSIGVGLSAGLLLVVVALAVLLVIVPKATGSTPLTVLTSSMEPSLPPGTLLVVRPTSTEDVRVGDVMTYQIESGRPEVISHRVIEIVSASDGTTSFVTKGDNNSAADEKAVLPVQVRGTLWYSVPWLGFVNQAVNGQARAWIVPLLAVALFGYAGYMITSGLVAHRAERRRGRGRGRRSAGRSEDASEGASEGRSAGSSEGRSES